MHPGEGLRHLSRPWAAGCTVPTSVRRDFSVLPPAASPLQAVCLPPDNGRLAVGGLALWKSRRDYLRIDVGSLGPGIVAFGGCIDNRDFITGRGRLSAGATWLRLERSGATVSALCSTNGAGWYSVGTVGFPSADPLEVGMFVDGMVRPEIYPRSYAAGSEVRFARFDLLKEWNRQGGAVQPPCELGDYRAGGRLELKQSR